MSGKLMSRGSFAEYCGVSAATVTNWMDAGMPAERSGRQGAQVAIDPREAIPWVINHREPEGSQRERLASEQADKVAMENEVRRGRLIDVAIVEENLMGVAAYLAQSHDAVAGRIAHELAGINDPGIIRTKVLAELREIRDGIATYSLRTSDALERMAESIDGGEGAAEPDPEPVGGPEEEAPRRKRRARKVEK